MVQKLEEYLFQEIGRRVKKERKKRGQSQTQVEDNKLLPKGILSQIETGKIPEKKDFMSETTRKTLAKYLMDGDQLKLLFGDEGEIRSLLARILYTLVLNGNRPSEDTMPFEPFEIEYHEDYDEISNSVIKLMLFHPGFNKEFLSHFLYKSISSEKLLERRNNLSEENEKIKNLIETSSGEFITEILSSSFDKEQFSDAFHFVIDKLSDNFFNLLKTKLKQLIVNRTVSEEHNVFNFKSNRFEVTQSEQKIYSSLKLRFKFENFSKLLVNQDVIALLKNLFIKQTLEIETSIYYLNFISRYHFQNSLVSLLSETMEKVRTEKKVTLDLPDQKLREYYEDIYEVTAFYLGSDGKKAISLTAPTYPNGIDDTMLSDN